MPPDGTAITQQNPKLLPIVHSFDRDTVEGRAVVLSGSDDVTIRLWDACTLREQLSIRLGSAVISIVHDPSLGIVVGTPGGVLCIDLREGEGE